MASIGIAMDAPDTLQVLLLTAGSVALVHTAIGVDHTLPFVALARARAWSLPRLWAVTGLCGLAHVGSSIVLGGLGIGLGAAVESLSWIEGARGQWASWMLIGFGLLLTVRGFVRGQRKHAHSHVHVHDDGLVHTHPHDHQAVAHRHPHFRPDRDGGRGGRWFGVWGLFLVFVFGPCEPLIPLLMAPAALHHWSWVVAVTGLFTAVTVGVMLAIVTIAHLGLQHLHAPAWQRHAEMLSGLAVALSGVAVQVFGI